MNNVLTLGVCAVALGLAACGKPPQTTTATPAPTMAPSAASEAPPPPPVAATATVALGPTKGNKASGTLIVSVERGAVAITGDVMGLEPGSQHGFHIHEKGDCSKPDASSAGGHFNPTAMEHGDPATGTHHLGDMINLRADATGKAHIDLKLADVTLKDGGTMDIAGKAIVLHADADDYTTQPAGNSGGRIACGVIS